jgi:hypothetical protein
MCKDTLRGSPAILSQTDTCSLLKDLFDKNNNKALLKLGVLSKLNYDKDMDLDTLKVNVPSNNNLSNVIVITEDLTSLIDELKTLNNNKVNQGIQSSRGQLDLISSVLGSIDNSFRYNIYCNYAYYKREDMKFSDSDYIGISRFSFRNIHGNIGSKNKLD